MGIWISFDQNTHTQRVKAGSLIPGHGKTQRRASEIPMLEGKARPLAQIEQWAGKGKTQVGAEMGE